MEKLDQTEIIDHILQLLTIKESQELLKVCQAKFGLNHTQEFKEILINLCDKDILKKITPTYYSLTSTGRKAKELGGWKKFFESEEIHHSEVSFVKEKEKEKLIYETTLAKWQIKTFWYFFAFAIIGSVCGIIALILQLS